MPHPQYLHETPITYALGRKTTADIREFGRQTYWWKLESGKKKERKKGGWSLLVPTTRVSKLIHLSLDPFFSYLLPLISGCSL